MKFFRKKRLSSVIFLPLSVIFIAGCDQDLNNLFSQLVTTGCCTSVVEKECKRYNCSLYCDRGSTKAPTTDRRDCKHDLESLELAREAYCKCLKHKCAHSCNICCEATTTTEEAATTESTQTTTTTNTTVPATTEATTEEAALTESTQSTTTTQQYQLQQEQQKKKQPQQNQRRQQQQPQQYQLQQKQQQIREKAATREATATATTATVATLTELVQVAVAKIEVLNVTEEGSLMDAVDVINKLFKDLELVDKKRVRKNGSSVFVATQELETFAKEYSEIHYKANESRIIHTELYAMKIAKVPADTKTGVVFSLNETESSDKKGRNSISLPREVFEGKDAVVVCIIYDYVKRWITQDEQIHLDDMNKALNFKLGSRIFAASVYPAPSGTLEENVTISFTQDNEFKKEDTPHCCFWDHSTLNGSWSSRGCSLVKSVNNEITCACNHLTNFAVLMQVSASKGVSSKHSLALAVITYIGCALSLTGEVLTIIIYCVLMNLKQEQIQIRFNLAVAIAIAQIAFLSGIGATETESVCVSVAALIHFFYLAGFAWMLFEGAYLYLMVIKVFNTAVRMHVLYAVAWGVPAVIVALSIAIASSGDGGVHSYVHGDLCWLSFNNYLIWTFVAPVLLVCLANSVVLGLVLREILKMQSHNASEREKLMQGTKAFFVLFPLLGMTWVFGVLSVTDAGLVFQYIFTILNSLQGFLIFILHVVRNADVRAEFKRKKRMWKDARSIKASLCSRQDQSNTWTNKAVKIDAHELGGIANEAATCSDASTGYDNAFVFYNESSKAPVDM